VELVTAGKNSEGLPDLEVGHADHARRLVVLGPVAGVPAIHGEV